MRKEIFFNQKLLRVVHRFFPQHIALWTLSNCWYLFFFSFCWIFGIKFTLVTLINAFDFIVSTKHCASLMNATQLIGKRLQNVWQLLNAWGMVPIMFTFINILEMMTTARYDARYWSSSGKRLLLNAQSNFWIHWICKEHLPTSRQSRTFVSILRLMRNCSWQFTLWIRTQKRSKPNNGMTFEKYDFQFFKRKFSLFLISIQFCCSREICK